MGPLLEYIIYKTSDNLNQLSSLISEKKGNIRYRLIFFTKTLNVHSNEFSLKVKGIKSILKKKNIDNSKYYVMNKSFLNEFDYLLEPNNLYIIQEELITADKQISDQARIKIIYLIVLDEDYDNEIFQKFINDII